MTRWVCVTHPRSSSSPNVLRKESTPMPNRIIRAQAAIALLKKVMRRRRKCVRYINRPRRVRTLGGHYLLLVITPGVHLHLRPAPEKARPFPSPQAELV